jgi:paraquat-inducible protein A
VLPKPKARLHLLLVSLITASFVLYVAGLHMPLFHTTKFWVIEDEVTLIGTVGAFWYQGEKFLGVVVLVFTIIFPLLKFIAVYWGLLSAPSRFSRGVNHWFSILGKWSMLDVFVVGLLLLNIKLDSQFLDMELRMGVVVFGISIILTMIVGTYAGYVRRSVASPHEPNSSANLRSNT